MKNISIHRFHDLIGLSVPGKGETVYLSHTEATALAKHLRAAAKSVKDCKFTDSSIGTLSVETPDLTHYRKDADVDRTGV